MMILTTLYDNLHYYPSFHKTSLFCTLSNTSNGHNVGTQIPSCDKFHMKQAILKNKRFDLINILQTISNNVISKENIVSVVNLS